MHYIEWWVGEWLCPDHFTVKKQAGCPLNRRVGGRQSRSGRFWKIEKISCTILTMDSPASRPVSLPAELSLLLFNMKQKKKLTQAVKLLICTRKVPSSEPERILTIPFKFSITFSTRKWVDFRDSTSFIPLTLPQSHLQKQLLTTIPTQESQTTCNYQQHENF